MLQNEEIEQVNYLMTTTILTTIFLFRIKNVSPLGTLFTILYRSKIVTITMTIIIMIIPN